MNYKRSKEHTCSFTGYRPGKLPWGDNDDDPRCQEVKSKMEDIIQALYTSGIRHFICGMALGADMIFCDLVLKFRDYRDDVTVEAAIPCEEQCKGWAERDRNRYFRLVSQCDIETLLQTRYTSDCMLKRNKYMVDNSSVLVALYDGKFGGTMQTVEYAKKRGREIIRLAP